MSRIFGTDGIRGQANIDLTPDLALSLGRGVVRLLREEGEKRPSVLIGRDPRWSGEMLLAALAAGITSAGGDAVDVGVLPTPAVAFLASTGSASAGAIISASHNPVGDNGIKFFGRDGYKLTDEEEDRLQDIMDTEDDAPPTGTAVGRIQRDTGAVIRYIDHLVQSAPHSLDGLKVVIDGANGAASTVAPQVYRRLGAQVHTFHCTPTGSNINDGCGSTHPDEICALTKDLGADVGIAHDGDADRLIAASASGVEVDGDVILGILARRSHERGELANDAVVTTVMTNLGFKHAMQKLDIDVVETAVGDRYVLEAMKAQGLNLGGEQSGHLILLDHATTGDGLLTAVHLMGVMAESGASLDDLATVMSRLPQVLVNVPDVDKARLEGAADVWDAVAAEEDALGDDGRVLVRPSGTEPVIRVMVEATTEDGAREAADRIAEVVRVTLGTN